MNTLEMLYEELCISYLFERIASSIGELSFDLVMKMLVRCKMMLEVRQQLIEIFNMIDKREQIIKELNYIVL